jgi:peptidoglycan/LPS O-acetylase OafA/YrhL
MRWLSDFAHGRENNFNLLRLVAALLVIYAHSFPMVQGLSGHAPNWSGDWFFGLTGMDSGRLAVQVFFVVSGFLVAQSLTRRPALLEFFQARALRVLPGLTVAVLFCAFVVGPAFTKLPLHDYLLSGELRYFLSHNLTLRNDPTQFLPGVFVDQAYPRVVNGSLWTLPWEAAMYLSLAFLAATRLFRRRALVGALFLVVFLSFCYSREGHKSSLPYVAQALAFSTFFYLGVLAWLFRERVPMRHATLIGAVALFAVTIVFYKQFVVLRCLYAPLLAYCALGCALAPAGAIRGFNQAGDYSYGVYVYAFPLQQSLVHVLPGLSPMQLWLAATMAALLLAIPSWHLLEKPMLAFKRPSRDARPPAAATIAAQPAR